MGHGHALGEGGLEEDCDICAHEVDFHKSLAVFTSPRPMLWKVAWKTEGFKTRPQNAPSGSALALLVCVRIYSTEERRLHTTCLETAKKAMESFGLFE